MTDLEVFYMVVGIAVGIIAIVTGLAGAIRWMVKHYLAELKPNSGSTIKDQVGRLESRMTKHETVTTETYRRVEKLEHKIDDIYDRLIDFLSK